MAAGRKNFDPRRLMERAIDVMRSSIDENRDDGKPTPRVGAVLWKPDGTVETACRGELREGDHAEFTLLERKNRSNALDGCVLFSTLEPCAPGARRHPKMSCAERVSLARITEVWVGIEDPDPSVDRKGIKHLQDRGVEVKMFDRDLQEVIQKENRAFMADALDRAARAAKHPEEIILSDLELAVSNADISTLSAQALELYRERAKISDPVGSAEFNRLLLQQGLLRPEGGRLTPSGFGLLLFARRPRVHLKQAGVLALIEHDSGEPERREFDEPLVLIPEMFEAWLSEKLPRLIDRSQMRRTEQVDLPMSLIREGLVNALVHRDYDNESAKIQIVVSREAIIIRSPGGPLPPITLEQLQSFTAPMLSRNPKVHYVFSRMGLAEEQGIGIRWMRRDAERLHLPLPIYSWDAPYLVLTIYRSREAVTDALPPEIRNQLSESELEAWQWFSQRDSGTSSEYARQRKIDTRTARRHFKRLVEAGLLARVGSGPATEYRRVRK